MPASDQYDQLYQAIANGETRHIFKWLRQLRNKEVRTCVRSLIIDDHHLYRLVQRILRVFPLELALRCFCEQVEDMHRAIFVSFSSQSYHPPAIQPLLAMPQLKTHLYMAFVQLYAHVQLRKARFLKVRLSSTNSSISLTLDTDIAFLDGVYQTKEFTTCIALYHIKQANASLTAGYRANQPGTFRLTLTVDLSLAQAFSAN